MTKWTGARRVEGAHAEHRCAALRRWPARFVYPCLCLCGGIHHLTRVLLQTGWIVYLVLYKSDHAGVVKPFHGAVARHRWLNSCQQQIRRGRKCRRRHDNRGASNSQLWSSSLSVTIPLHSSSAQCTFWHERTSFSCF